MDSNCPEFKRKRKPLTEQLKKAKITQITEIQTVNTHHFRCPFEVNMALCHVAVKKSRRLPGGCTYRRMLTGRQIQNGGSN